MVVYGVALLALCMLVGIFLGELLGSLIGVQANVGGVGIAMLLLLILTNLSSHKLKLNPVSETGVAFWSAMYIPIVVAMAAKQNVVAALSSGWLAVVAGVAAPSRAVASSLAKSAAEAGADALVAMPPYISPASLEQVMDYFRAMADASGLPIMVQHARMVPLPPAFLVRLLTEIDEVKYIKEEREPSAHNLTQVIRDVGDECLGIFGGGHGRWMMSEMERGSSGFMPAAQTLDLYVKTWDAFQSGDKVEARRLYDAHLPLINQLILVGLQVCKEVLVRRGVFENNLMRMPGAVQMDEGDHRELDEIMGNLMPYLEEADG